MGRIRTFLFYVAFWVLAIVIALVLGSVGRSAIMFKAMMVYGAGDPQLMAGIISETMVTWLTRLLFISLLIYPLYILFRHKMRYLWLAGTIVLVFVFALLSKSSNIGMLHILLNFVVIGVFSFLAAELPYRIRARKRFRKSLEETKRTFG